MRPPGSSGSWSSRSRRWAAISSSWRSCSAASGLGDRRAPAGPRAGPEGPPWWAAAGAAPARVADQAGARRAARGSAVVAGPAGRRVLVQLPVEVETLQDELDGGGDARRLAAPAEGVERAAEPALAVGVRGIVLGRHRPAYLADQPVLERGEQLVE